MKTLKNEQKIELNTCFDLYRTPIYVLKTTKIYNFKGKYFDQLYEEALRIERNNIPQQKIEIINNNFPLIIKTIEFEIFYFTEVNKNSF